MAAETIGLTTMGEDDGFVVTGDAGDISAAGDVNGDGFDDLIIGVPRYNGNSRPNTGAAYVVYGSAGSAADIDLEDFSADNGFVIRGWKTEQRIGELVRSAGDVDGDGFDDVEVVDSSGTLYYVYGRDDGIGRVNLENLNADNGYKVTTGEDLDPYYWGFQPAGDVNGDGHDDTILILPPASTGESARVFALYGTDRPVYSVNLDNLGAAQGFEITGPRHLDFYYVAAGDFNGDGLTDVITQTGGTATEPAVSYVVFGSTTQASPVNVTTLSPGEGITIPGLRNFSTAGDVDGDGIDDLVVTAYDATERTMTSVVLFGGPRFETDFDYGDVDESDTLRINWSNTRLIAVTSAGDVNGDGFDDLLVKGKPDGSVPFELHVVFGSAERGRVVEIDRFSAFEGFTIVNSSGLTPTAAGDLNGDGYDDIAIVDGYGSTHVVYGSAYDAVTLEGTSGVDTLDGTAEADVIAGLDGSDVIRGLKGDDDIDGGFGQDRIRAGAGNDIVFGGGGADVLYGGTDNDALDGGKANDRIYGEDGDDVLYGREGSDTLEGAQGADILYGHVGNDTLSGGGNIDILDGGTGDDVMIGGVGDDIYYVDAAGDTVVEAAGGGTDTIHASADHTLAAEVEILILSGDAVAGTGNSLGNKIFGTDQNNTLDGADGNDVIEGGSGLDTIFGRAGNDQISGGKMADTIDGGDGVDVLVGDGGDDVIFGGDGNDDLNGGSENDRLEGGAGDDVLLGAKGYDVLRGGRGDDLLTGGTLRDEFLFDISLANTGVDIITDFTSGTSNTTSDNIVLDDLVFTALTPGVLAASAFATGSAASDADDRIIYNTTNGVLLYDADGTGAGAAIHFATLAGAATLVASDILVI
ncbi:FG-GAP repeat protein [Methylobrevis pamukkalensis]|uniref:Bifunctional hemolysin/adenylate cyclase n=1 Tax=Methylobrevis pamukkalensis TaxID=1439726 RepID=A0A1E3GY93_9HYPH|nr:FG-GAP repeat protein [Methylobrevis pamukkalensis]ODN69028.1 Bifunctional hemolysin/adenylate cyclase precursor [Methylobrevis pamukkalensis]